MLKCSLCGVLANHYGDHPKWFLDEEECQDNISGAFMEMYHAWEVLAELRLDAPPGPVAEWQLACGWRDRPARGGPSSPVFRDALLHFTSRIILDSTVFSLLEVSSRVWDELPNDEAVRRSERDLWPGHMTLPRPDVNCLLVEGMVDDAWRHYICNLVAGFRHFISDGGKLHTDVPKVRSLVVRAYFLAMDMQYLRRLLEYAWFLHARDDQEWNALRDG